MTDFELQNHGSVAILRPVSDEAADWVEQKIGRDAGYQPFYPSIVVEPRYIDDIVGGIVEDGLSVE